jgi:hypothetical protein
MTKITNSVSDGVTIRKAEGSLNAAEIIAAIGEHSPTLATDKVIWDFTNAYAHKLSSTDLKEIAHSVLETNSHRPSKDKTAIIFASELEFDLGKQTRKYLENNNLPYQLAIFKDMHDELIWLYTD